MSVSFTVDQRGLHDAMARYAALKGKSDADVVNKAMRFWLPFAGNKVRKITKNAGQLRRELTNQARKPSRGKNKARHQLTNSVAAAIVAARLRARGRTHFPKSSDGPKSAAFVDEFYHMVERLVNAKVRSINYLRAGFIPAYRQFNLQRLNVAGQTHFKGRSKGIKAVPKLTGIVEAFATNQREGAVKMAPDAFTASIPEVRAQFLKWIEADIRANAIRSGFY